MQNFPTFYAIWELTLCPRFSSLSFRRSETLPSTSSPQILRTVPLYPIPLPSSVAPSPASLIEFEITQPADESIWAEIERVLDTVVGIAREVRDEEAEAKMDLDAAETDELKTREFKNVVLCESKVLSLILGNLKADF